MDDEPQAAVNCRLSFDLDSRRTGSEGLRLLLPRLIPRRCPRRLPCPRASRKQGERDAGSTMYTKAAPRRRAPPCFSSPSRRLDQVRARRGLRGAQDSALDRRTLFRRRPGSAPAAIVESAEAPRCPGSERATPANTASHPHESRQPSLTLCTAYRDRESASYFRCRTLTAQWVVAADLCKLLPPVPAAVCVR